MITFLTGLLISLNAFAAYIFKKSANENSFLLSLVSALIYLMVVVVSWGVMHYKGLVYLSLIMATNYVLVYFVDVVFFEKKFKYQVIIPIVLIVIGVILFSL